MGRGGDRIHTHACVTRGGAKKDGWRVISMKNDWKRIFAFE